MISVCYICIIGRAIIKFNRGSTWQKYWRQEIVDIASKNYQLVPKSWGLVFASWTIRDNYTSKSIGGAYHRWCSMSAIADSWLCLYFMTSTGIVWPPLVFSYLPWCIMTSVGVLMTNIAESWLPFASYCIIAIHVGISWPHDLPRWIIASYLVSCDLQWRVLTSVLFGELWPPLVDQNIFAQL